MSESITEHEYSNNHKNNFCSRKMVEMSIFEDKSGVDRTDRISLVIPIEHINSIIGIINKRRIAACIKITGRQKVERI